MSRFAHDELVGAVKRLSARYDRLNSFEGCFNGVQIVNFDEKEASPQRTVSKGSDIFPHALDRLIHQLDVTLLQDDKAEPVPFGHLGSDFESQAVDSEREAWFNLALKQDGGHIFHAGSSKISAAERDKDKVKCSICVKGNTDPNTHFIKHRALSRVMRANRIHVTMNGKKP